MEEKKHMPLPEIPQWVLEYNAKGYQSSAGKALSLTMKTIESIKAENERLASLAHESNRLMSDNEELKMRYDISVATIKMANEQNAKLVEALKGLTSYFEFMIQDPHFHEYVKAKEALQSIEQNKL